MYATKNNAGQESQAQGNCTNNAPRKAQRYYFMCYEELVSFLNDTDQALIIQRLHYWLQNDGAGYLLQDGCKWIYNGYNEWLEQFSWLSVGQFGRHIRYLEEIGWVVTARFHQLKREVGFIDKPPLMHEYNQRKWYKLDYQKIYEDTGFDLLFEKYGKKRVAPQTTVEPARLSNLQNWRLENPNLKIPNSEIEQSSIYKENQSIIQNTTRVVSEKNDCQDDGLAAENEPPQVPSCSTQVLEESPPVQNAIAHEDKVPRRGDNLIKPKALKLMGVDLQNPRLLKSAALVSHDDLAEAVDAFLEYCRIKQVQKPTSCLITAIEEGWKPENPGKRSRSQNDDLDPIDESLMMWRVRWDKLPEQRLQMKRDIAAEFPGGEIVIIDDSVGPVRGTS